MNTFIILSEKLIRTPNGVHGAYSHNKIVFIENIFTAKLIAKLIINWILHWKSEMMHFWLCFYEILCAKILPNHS